VDLAVAGSNPVDHPTLSSFLQPRESVTEPEMTGRT